MKTRTAFLSSFAAVLVACSGHPISAAESKAGIAHAHPVKFAEHNSSASVGRGDSQRTVERTLGHPARKLSADVWVYPNYGGVGAPDVNDGCHLLLITFTEGTVSDMQLVNDRAEKIYAARLRPTSGEKPKVASK